VNKRTPREEWINVRKKTPARAGKEREIRRAIPILLKRKKRRGGSKKKGIRNIREEICPS